MQTNPFVTLCWKHLPLAVLVCLAGCTSDPVIEDTTGTQRSSAQLNSDAQYCQSASAEAMLHKGSLGDIDFDAAMGKAFNDCMAARGWNIH
jgi:hypothetical protein